MLDADFCSTYLPLLERGWVLALAHVRGGGELGPEWHQAGATSVKHRSASDLIDAVRALHAQGISSPAATTAVAESAGGLALGGALNLAPDLFAAAVLRAPFVDPTTAMIDPALALTVEEREEWRFGIWVPVEIWHLGGASVGVRRGEERST